MLDCYLNRSFLNHAEKLTKSTTKRSGRTRSVGKERNLAAIRRAANWRVLYSLRGLPCPSTVGFQTGVCVRHAINFILQDLVISPRHCRDHSICQRDDRERSRPAHDLSTLQEVLTSEFLQVLQHVPNLELLLPQVHWRAALKLL